MAKGDAADELFNRLAASAAPKWDTPEDLNRMSIERLWDRFRYENGKVIVTEVVTTGDDGRAVLDTDGMTVVTREVTYDIPAEYRAQAPIYCSLLP